MTGTARRGSRPTDRPTVPRTVTVGGETVVVGRAWPARIRADGLDLLVEGRDGRGRLRAGRLSADGTGCLLPPGEDPRLPGLRRTSATGVLLVHRAGRRAVVRTTATGSYVKLLPPQRIQAIARAAEVGGQVARAVGLAAPRVLDADEAGLTCAALPGTSVHDLAGPGSSPEQWRRIWSAWTEGWVGLHRLGATPTGRPTDLPVHSWADEAAVVAGWFDKVRAGRLLPGTVWAARASSVVAALAELPSQSLVPTHRDLHDKQLCWDGHRLGVLDFDTLSLADPAIDLANLAVHARLRQAQGTWTGGAAATVETAVAVVAEASAVDPARLAHARRAVIVRLAAVYSVRPGWRDLVLAWAERAWHREDENALTRLSPGSPASLRRWTT